MTVEREAVRALVLTPERELLLLRKRGRGPDRSFWLTPGGGIQPGEDPLACLRRELREELGLDHFEPGPLIWRRRHVMPWSTGPVVQREHYYAIELPKFTPTMTDPVELRTIEEMRWWPLHELAGTSEVVNPVRLSAIVEGYLRNGAPSDPDNLPFQKDE